MSEHDGETREGWCIAEEVWKIRGPYTFEQESPDVWVWTYGKWRHKMCARDIYWSEAEARDALVSQLREVRVTLVRLLGDVRDKMKKARNGLRQLKPHAEDQKDMSDLVGGEVRGWAVDQIAGKVRGPYHFTHAAPSPGTHRLGGWKYRDVDTPWYHYDFDRVLPTKRVAYLRLVSVLEKRRGVLERSLRDAEERLRSLGEAVDAMDQVLKEEETG